MNKFFKFKSHLLVIICATLLFVSCSVDDDAPDIPDENIVELAVANTNLQSLVMALERADLVTVLQDNGPFTVLAPSNEAFDQFLTDNGFDSIEDIPLETLRQVLLNHVISGVFALDNLNSVSSGYLSTNADGPVADSRISSFFTTTDGIEINGASNIINNESDIRASNGIIHAVDAVIPIPNIVDFIVLDESFSSLEAALTAEGQPDFPAILSSGTDPAPFTIFAPSNTAFADLDNAPTGDDLTAVLQHHVIAENNINASMITNGLESPPTLEGDSITFFVAGGIATIQDGSGNTESDIIFINIQGSNGIIHAIDQVLIPDTTNNP